MRVPKATKNGHGKKPNTSERAVTLALHKEGKKMLVIIKHITGRLLPSSESSKVGRSGRKCADRGRTQNFGTLADLSSVSLVLGATVHAKYATLMQKMSL